MPALRTRTRWATLVVFQSTFILIAGYITVTLVGVVCSIFLAVHALWHMHLPLSMKISRRAVLRQRLVVATACYTIGCVGVFCTAAAFGGDVPLWGNGICEVFFTLFYPFRICATVMVAALWVNSLSSRVLPVTSFATRLKAYAEKRQVFVKLALAVMVVMFGVGFFSWFSPREAMYVADTLSAIFEALTGFCIVFVASQTFAVIDRGRAQQSSDTARAFYRRSKHLLIWQVIALFSANVVYATTTYLIHFTFFGRHTAIIPVVVKFSNGMLWLCAVVHFARPDKSSRTRGSIVPCVVGSLSPRSRTRGSIVPYVVVSPGVVQSSIGSGTISVSFLFRAKQALNILSSWIKQKAGFDSHFDTWVTLRVQSRPENVLANVVVPTA